MARPDDECGSEARQPSAEVAALRVLYERAVYRVDAPEGSFALRVGAPSAALDRLLRAHGARTFAFLTAANPHSRPLPDELNRERNARLLARLAAAARRCFAGVGSSAADDWPAEASWLVLDLTEPEAVELAREFEQSALLVGELGAAVRLRFVAS